MEPAFFDDVKAGNLPDFTYLQPRSSVHGVNKPPTWQHPDASVREGEALIKRVSILFHVQTAALLYLHAQYTCTHIHTHTDTLTDIHIHIHMISAQVYESLRSSPLWSSTLFIITYDEHGGFYDHVAPPRDVPSPDGIIASNGFDFTQLGVRIPT
ncbi:hypothetical protein EON64_19255, partial [archaeon]